MNKSIVCAAALGLALVARRPVLAEVESGDDHGADGVPNVVRPAHDVACRLTVDAIATARAGSGVTTKLSVTNKSRRREPNVQVSIFANAPVGTPLWTGTLDLKGHHRKSRNVHLDVPAGTTSLVAVASCDDDANPGNNIAGVDVSGHDDGGGTTGGTTVPPAANASVLAGAATYSANCATCHGVDANGTKNAPRIVGRSAHSVLEALREGDDGMPRFPAMTSADASNIAAFLANPAAATQPTTPIPPTNGATPTYAGQIATLLQANCVVCHTGTFASGSAATGPVRLDGYANASKNAALALGAMQGGVMPPGTPLSASSIQLFSDWIAGGKQQ